MKYLNEGTLVRTILIFFGEFAFSPLEVSDSFLYPSYIFLLFQKVYMEWKKRRMKVETQLKLFCLILLFDFFFL